LYESLDKFSSYKDLVYLMTRPPDRKESVMPLTSDPLSEVAVRCETAYDQLLTAACLGHTRLSEHDSKLLSVAIDCLKHVLAEEKLDVFVTPRERLIGALETYDEVTERINNNGN
jgi:hypothetical protein